MYELKIIVKINKIVVKNVKIINAFSKGYALY